VAASESGARGCLVTDWGDFGHLQPLPVSYLGLLAGAGFAWNVGAAAEPLGHPWPELLDRHAFGDAAGVTGSAALALADAYLRTGARQKNGTALFYLVAFPQQDLTHRRYEGLAADALAATERWVDEAVAGLGRSRMPGSEDALVRGELGWVAGLLRLACKLGRARLEAGRAVPVQALPETTRRRLRAELLPLVEQHREVWLARNRPGGREDSVARLERLGRLLAGDAEVVPPPATME
jgi:hypothetical protein